jgi:hypothetical protein
VTTTTMTGQPRRPGRPPCCSRELAILIIKLHQRGLSYARICTELNAAQIPTPLGSPTWQKSHVDRLLHTRWVKEIIEEFGTW